MKTFILAVALLGSQWAKAQTLKPGFDPKEYLDLLAMFDRGRDTPWNKDKVLPISEACHLVYRSPQFGLENRWDLWLRGDSVGVISIRGTVGNEESWLENFYCAMVPATGILQLNDSTLFKYKLAEDYKACIHAGWLVGLASLAPDVVREIKVYAKKGIRNFIITGHSQGGSLSLLMTAYLRYLDPQTWDGKSLVFKTYSSAPSKPGNLYFVYDYDYITRDGWGLRVVNTRDWVPESPFSLQTLQDLNDINPFKKESFFSKAFLGRDYTELDSSSRQAEVTFQLDLGHAVYLKIKKYLPQLVEPKYVPSMAYTPAGVAVILPPYPGYDKEFVGSAMNIMEHHGLKAYYQLVLKDYNIAP